MDGRGDRAEPPELLLAGDGPVWSRHYSQAPGEEECACLGSALQIAGARRMIVGHTVQVDGISSACGGRVFRVDVGMAAAYGGKPSALEIAGDRIRIIGSESAEGVGGANQRGSR